METIIGSYIQMHTFKKWEQLTFDYAFLVRPSRVGILDAPNTPNDRMISNKTIIRNVFFYGNPKQNYGRIQQNHYRNSGSTICPIEMCRK